MSKIRIVIDESWTSFFFLIVNGRSFETLRSQMKMISSAHSSSRELTARPKSSILLREMKAEKSSEVVARDDAATNWHENWS